MDTRKKIAPGTAVVVTGHFDPLTAAHARRIGELKVPGRPLVVVLTSPPDPILPAAARAELVASLAAVDQVIMADLVAREEPADEARTRALIELVRSRQ